MRKYLSLCVCLALSLVALHMGAGAVDYIELDDGSYVVTGDLEEVVVEEILVEDETDGQPMAIAETDTEGAIAAIYEGLRNGDATIDLSSYYIAYTSISAIYNNLLAAHPELFYVSGIFDYARPSSSVYILELYPTYNSMISEKEAFEEKVAYILSAAVDDGMSDLEIALALHDYLVLNCAYDWNVANDKSALNSYVHTAYGAIIAGDAVCDGYAKAYQLLLQRAGVDAGLITNSGHAWNWVEIDGEKYHVDVTWDDPVYRGDGGKADRLGGCRHTYFLVDSEYLEENDSNNDHADYDTVTYNFTDSEYTSGYLFSGAYTAFYWENGGFYYVTSKGVMVYTQSLEGTYTSTDTRYLTLRLGDWIYYTSSTGSLLYSYCISDGTTREENDSSLTLSSVGYGLVWDEDAYEVVVVKHDGTESPSEVVVVDGPEETISIGTYLQYDADYVIISPTTDDPDGFMALTNYSSEAQTISVVLAAYNSNGKMTGVSMETVDLDAGESCLVSFTGASGGDTVKILYLDASYAPLCSAKILS